MKIIVINPGKEPQLKDIESMQSQITLFYKEFFNAKLGHLPSAKDDYEFRIAENLSIFIGTTPGGFMDKSKPYNFDIEYPNRTEDEIYGTAIFARYDRRTFKVIDVSEEDFRDVKNHFKDSRLNLGGIRTVIELFR